MFVTISGKILKRVDAYSSNQIDDVWRQVEYSLSAILNAGEIRMKNNSYAALW